MSRIGKRPVAIPSGVTAAIENGTLNVKGPKGTLSMGMSELVSYKVEDGQISITPANDSQAARGHWGMQRTLVSNLVEGVTEGFSATATMSTCRSPKGWR
jgi:large subunit ribosomal protein L6